MTPELQRAEQLAALDKLRNLRALADEAIGTLERVLTETALTTPVLREPEPVWAWAADIAKHRKVTKGAVVATCRRAHARGDTHLARKVGKRWQGRLDLMAPERSSQAR